MFRVLGIYNFALWFTYSCFTGFSGGAYALVAPYYVSEIAETSMRGALASLMQLMVTFGVLFVNALNIYDTVHWVTISGICIGIPGKKVFSLNFVYSEKATKFCKISTLLLSTVQTDKSKVEILKILWPSQNI